MRVSFRIKIADIYGRISTRIGREHTTKYSIKRVFIHYKTMTNFRIGGRCHNLKNGKEASEVTEGKSSKISGKINRIK